MADNIARIIDADIGCFKETEKVSSSHRLERDLILYILWQTGLFTNQQIADVFNISFSMVSHAVHEFRRRLRRDRDLREKTHILIAQWVTPFPC